jgi:photosynthetic reaction center cytochrome c subunit
MKVALRNRIFWTTGTVTMCLLGVATVANPSASPSAARAALQAAPAAPAQGGAEQGLVMAENHFKNIQVLKGMPVDTFIEAMGLFAASMGGDCTYCHSKEAIRNRDAFSIATPRIQRARQMIVMMRGINNNNFGGALKVTCFTCHRGSYVPETAPRLALQYGTPDEDPNVMNFVPDTSLSATQVLDKYLEALGGTGRLAKLSSFTAKGTYSGFDTGFSEVPVEIFAKTPNQRATVVHLDYGQNVRVYDGRNGWFAGPDSPAPLVTLTTGTLDLARMEALVAFPTGIKQAFAQWVVGTSIIDDNEVQIVQGTNPGLLPVNLYFDKTGLLVRLVRWNQTAVGPVPTQIDYADYREVDGTGVKMPFTWTISQTYMQMTIKVSEVQPNVPIAATRFARPAPATR